MLSSLVKVTVFLGNHASVLPVVLDRLHGAPHLRTLTLIGGDRPPDVTMLPPGLKHLMLCRVCPSQQRALNFNEEELGALSFTGGDLYIMPVRGKR